MKAMILGACGPPQSRPLRPADLPVPEPGTGEIRLRVSACGVCRTDLHIAEGELAPSIPKPCLIPGHQAAGKVDGIGPDAEGFRLGDAAGAAWLYSACGRCEFCGSGRENLCESARFTGLDADGGYAEYMVVPASHAFHLPENLSPSQAAPLLCAGVIGYRSLKMSGIQPGQRLGLFGFGASAHLALQTALIWNCRVHVFTRDAGHRRLASSMGAAWVGAPGEKPPAPLHAAVTFAPSGAVAAAALATLAKGGAVAINAVHMDPLPPLPYPLLYHERCIKSVANLTRADVREFLALAAAGSIRARVTSFELEEANSALERIKTSTISGAAVLRIGPDG